MRPDAPKSVLSKSKPCPASVTQKQHQQQQYKLVKCELRAAALHVLMGMLLSCMGDACMKQRQRKLEEGRQ
jgi:hypothetical protein